MKLLKKLTKFDKVLENIRREQEEDKRNLENSSENATNASKISTNLPEELDYHAPVRIGVKKTFLQIWELLAGIRRKLPRLFFLMIFNSIMGLFSISLIIPFVLMLQNVEYVATNVSVENFGFFKRTVIEFSRDIYHILDLNSVTVLVVIYGAVFTLSFIVRNLLGVYVGYRISIYSAEATKHFASKIFSVLLYISYSYYLGKSAARTMYALNLSFRCHGFIFGLFSTINDLLLMLLIGLGVALWSPPIIIIIFVMFFISYFVYKVCHLELKRISKLEIELNRRSNQSTYQGIHNFTFSRLFHAEPFFVRMYHKMVDYTIPLGAYKSILTALPRLVIETAIIFAFVLYSVFTIVRNPGNVDEILTTAAVLAGAVLKLMPAALRLTGYLSSFASDQVAIEEFYKEYHNAVAHKVDSGEYTQVDSLEFNKKIVVKNVSYQYPIFDSEGIDYTYDKSPFILQNINLEINKGEKIGIIGGSGGGKTTFIHILMAFLDPTRGKILVDGKNIKDNMRKWHKNLGYVPQETMLLSDTVINNIAFGQEIDSIDKNKATEALKVAKLWDVVEKMPQGLDTFIGDNGKRLSGGQRQRLGIARALYRDPSVMIFDEATSHLDTKTEVLVQEAIDNIDSSKTVIIVAHRLNTLKNCDRVFCFERGKIAFEGSYKEMIKKYG